MVQDITTLGSNVSCLAGRETIQYQAVVFPHHIPLALDVLADTIQRPALRPEEVEQEKQTIAYELEDLSKKPETLLIEYAHMAAYGREGLGLPVACPEDNLERLNVDIVHVRARRGRRWRASAATRLTPPRALPRWARRVGRISGAASSTRAVWCWPARAWRTTCW